MRRRIRNAYRLRAFFDGRVDEIRSGRDLDLFVDLVRLRVVAASLVETGVVSRDDWEMPSVPLPLRGAAIDVLRSSFTDVVRGRILDPSIGLDDVERRILFSFAQLIASVVVEMALVVLSRDGSLACLASHASKPRRSGNRFAPDPEVQVAKSALHSDPEAFLQNAIERRDAAVLDISRAKRRISYTGVERDEAVPKEYLPPVSLDSAAYLASISAIRGATDDLSRAIKPVPRPAPAPARRRR